MSKWNDFFAMSRHERRGAIVVLIMLLIAVGVHIVLVHTPIDQQSSDTAIEQRFLEHCDSLKQEDSTAKNKSHSHARKKCAKKKASPLHKTPAPRRLNPVPSF